MHRLTTSTALKRLAGEGEDDSDSEDERLLCDTKQDSQVEGGEA